MAMTRKRKTNPPAPFSTKPQQVVSSRHVSYSETHVGPLPPARDLVLIEENIPGAVEHIIALAEREQENQAKLTEKIVQTNCLCIRRSQIFSFVFAILYMAFLFYLASQNNQVALKYAIVSGLVVGLPAVIYSLMSGFKRRPKEN